MTAQSLDFPAIAIPQAADRSGGLGSEVPTTLICDNSLLHSGLQRILSGTQFTLVEDAAATAARLGIEVAQGPALVILAVSQLSSRTTEMVRQVNDCHPVARIVLLADHFDPEFVRQGLEAGANGFCLTGSSPEVLITSLELVMLGELALPAKLVLSMLDAVVLSPEPEPASKVPNEPKASDPKARSLSAREAEILSSLMEGEPNKIIARKLHVAEATVKVHVKAILRKIGATNRTQAAMWAKGHLHD
jgi:two-component system, NarL family, nitrate/nitrite response regulator NarL